MERIKRAGKSGLRCSAGGGSGRKCSLDLRNSRERKRNLFLGCLAKKLLNHIIIGNLTLRNVGVGNNQTSKSEVFCAIDTRTAKFMYIFNSRHYQNSIYKMGYVSWLTSRSSYPPLSLPFADQPTMRTSSGRCLARNSIAFLPSPFSHSLPRLMNMQQEDRGWGRGLDDQVEVSGERKKGGRKTGRAFACTSCSGM